MWSGLRIEQEARTWRQLFQRVRWFKRDERDTGEPARAGVEGE